MGEAFAENRYIKKGILREYSKVNSCDEVLFNDGGLNPATLQKKDSIASAFL